MDSNLKGFADNLLFVLNIFVAVLLVIEDKLTIPHWLQSIGRMHPMVLHSPIVILMLAMVLEFFRLKKTQNNNPEMYEHFTILLLLTGSISAAIAAIMGLFLSKEDGYTGNVLQWHKWMGVSTLFLATIIYWCRNERWYKAPFVKAVLLSFLFAW